MKVIIPLLAVALLLLGSVDALACKHCRIVTNECVFLSTGGTSCDFSSGICDEVGSCPSAQAANMPLASQYAIASIERLDGERAITATQTARLAAKPTPKH